MFVNNIDPVFIHIGSLSIRYYGILFALGFLIGYFIIRHLAKKKSFNLTNDELDSYIIYLAFGTIIGARLFYCIVYNPTYYFSHILEFFFVWQGGLSFHGGMIGATIVAYVFCKKYNKNFLEIADITVVALAFGLALGRIGNFLNQELVGRVTNVPWCVQFKYSEGCRHPSQLYASLKDFIIFFTLFFLSSKKLRKGSIFGLFLVMYPVLRFIVEFFREPDPQIGFIFGLTMGQIISILMLLIGIVYNVWLHKEILHK